jgi:hypothetical protein
MDTACQTQLGADYRGASVLDLMPYGWTPIPAAQGVQPLSPVVVLIGANGAGTYCNMGLSLPPPNSGPALDCSAAGPGHVGCVLK